MEEHWAPEEGAGEPLVHRLHQEGLGGPLRWLQTCLRRTAGDREEDGVSHPVPLVPLTEENEDAMENRRFRALLRQLGLRPPASEQESFWRIPAALTPQQLRRAAASIAHRGPDPPGSPQGLPASPGCPQDVDAAPSPPAGAEPAPAAPGSEEDEAEEPQPPGRRKRVRRVEEEEEE
ncbi:TIM protein, partial [Caloenas nicobarica]|nr:TIM protein [Caloenas nicobarica]